jgi:hypothetical protein
MAHEDDLKQAGMALQVAGAALARLVPQNPAPVPLRTPVPHGTLIKADTEGPEAGAGPNKDSAANNPVPTEITDEEPKALMWDPYAIVEQLGYKDRPSQLTYGTLKAMAWKTPVLHAVIQTRVQQVASFCRPQHDRYQIGFRIKLRDSEKEPTKAEREWMREMETLITRTGVTEHPRGRDNFESFLRKVVWDTLVYDQMTFEVVPDRKGNPCQWYAVDSSTMRLADTASTFMDERQEKAIKYVQIYDGQVIAEYNQNELCFGVRNPRSDIRLFGYGVSELEMLIPTVTSLLWGFEYNQRFFSQGSAPKGLINFKGVTSEKQLQQFRRHWHMMCAGVENAWRTPITSGEDLQYVNLQQSSRDMEFNAWIDFLIKIACSMYSMDPAEVNFQYGNVGQKQSLQQASNKEKITESKERGLRPLLRFVAEKMNQHIVWPINEAFEFDFVGLDAQTRDQMADLNSKRVKTMVTIDEIRAEDDLPPLPDGKGEVILDPTYLQWAQLKEGMGMEGAPGEGGDMGEGEPENGEGGGGEDKTDFARLLAEYDEDEDEDEDENEDKGSKDKDDKKESKKSFVVDIDL